MEPIFFGCRKVRVSEGAASDYTSALEDAVLSQLWFRRIRSRANVVGGFIHTYEDPDGSSVEHLTAMVDPFNQGDGSLTHINFFSVRSGLSGRAPNVANAIKSYSSTREYTGCPTLGDSFAII